MADYDERLTPPAWLWLLAALLAASAGVALLPVLGGPVTAAVTAALGALAGWGMWSWRAPVRVAGGELVAGPAHIPVTLLGPPSALDAEAAAVLRGRGINPAAYHLIRPWVRCAVRVDVLDPADRTPYWYVATTRPEQLAAALEQAQRRPAGGQLG